MCVFEYSSFVVKYMAITARRFDFGLVINGKHNKRRPVERRPCSDGDACFSHVLYVPPSDRRREHYGSLPILWRSATFCWVRCSTYPVWVGEMPRNIEAGTGNQWGTDRAWNIDTASQCSSAAVHGLLCGTRANDHSVPMNDTADTLSTLARPYTIFWQWL